MVGGKERFQARPRVHGTLAGAPGNFWCHRSGHSLASTSHRSAPTGAKCNANWAASSRLSQLGHPSCCPQRRSFCGPGSMAVFEPVVPLVECPGAVYRGHSQSRRAPHQHWVFGVFLPNRAARPACTPQPAAGVRRTSRPGSTCRSLSRAKLTQKSQASTSSSRRSWCTTTHLVPSRTPGTHQGE